MTVKSTPISARQLHLARLWLAGLKLLDALQDEFFRLFKKTVQGFDAEDVHDLRVASRRLREGLALFAPILPRGRLRRLSHRVRGLTRLLGELRNADEAALFFTELESQAPMEAAPEARRLREELIAEGGRIRLQLEKDLRRFDAASLRKDFKFGPPNPFKRRQADPFHPFPPFAAAAFAERGAQAEALLPAALEGKDAAAQHRLRIAVKKLRYRLEIVAPLLSDQGEEARRTLKRYQDLLGELHDIDVFAGLVRERVADGAGREELLETIEKRRSDLFASFLKLDAKHPLGPLAARVGAGLTGRGNRQAR
ncbi:CHAD domain-containing protein [Geomonas terrae]|uniref:CHAD domain-containing protein n=1 Tax=Geomonas terrae TaxID=2562681 RepID=A0A4S1CCW0_9BACT|nr:CHAD domain-containing protein [Geomonas terrae]TGU71211.1 CHAD domain-containing protein [Geomonas terrae]